MDIRRAGSQGLSSCMVRSISRLDICPLTCPTGSRSLTWVSARSLPVPSFPLLITPSLPSVQAIVFLTPLSFYEVLEEDLRVNRLEDSVVLWKEICGNPLLQNSQIILFFNKVSTVVSTTDRSFVRCWHLLISFPADGYPQSQVKSRAGNQGIRPELCGTPKYICWRDNLYVIIRRRMRDWFLITELSRTHRLQGEIPSISRTHLRSLRIFPRPMFLCL